ncbi:MAG: SCP2 sterol-binding domain-containing protein [Noviherbaspirillum sp.]
MISSPVPALINHLLVQEAWATRKLALHAGKVVRIDTGMVALQLRIAADGLLEPAADAAPNVTIRMKLSDLPLMMQNRERAFSYVQVDGDAELANAVSQVSQGVRWEAEDDLSRLVGDIAARRIVSGGRAVFGAAQATRRRLEENLAEYFLEEEPLLVRPQAVAAFSADVAELRDDVERLAKRIERLRGGLA